MKNVPVAACVDAVVDSDVVVVGSGVAGLTTALRLRPLRVSVLSKTGFGEGSSRWAQGGVAAALGETDSALDHAMDTLRAGAGLSESAAVGALTDEAGWWLRWLMRLGARFDRAPSGALALGREGAHGARRILHAGGDATGAEMVRTLVHANIRVARARGNLSVHDRTFATDLALDGTRVVGVVARHDDGRRVLHRAPAVVLATGGCGQLYRHTTNPLEATGDGLAMAARAGARLGDLAFVQFHPTALAVDADPLPLVTEALRGEGAFLVDEQGQRFMTGVHPLAELAPRDIVSGAIWQHLEDGHTVALDARDAVGLRFPERFPTVWRHCVDHGLDARHEVIPVTPAAHYTMAGVEVGLRGRTTLDGLWACGEVTASGVHGANRLASNSLLEALVYGGRVGADIARTRDLRSPDRTALDDVHVRREAGGSSVAVPTGDERTVRRAVRTTMWRHVGLRRDEAGLMHALRRLHDLGARLGEEPTEVSNLVTVGRLIAAGAVAREESRGAHCRADRPSSAELASRRFWIYASSEPEWPLQAVPAPLQRREVA